MFKASSGLRASCVVAGGRRRRWPSQVFVLNVAHESHVVVDRRVNACGGAFPDKRYLVGNSNQRLEQVVVSSIELACEWEYEAFKFL